MPEDLLRKHLGGHPRPQLSPNFERNLARRLRKPAPKRLRGIRLAVLVVYAVLALAASVWIVARTGLPFDGLTDSWLMRAAVPLSFVAALRLARKLPALRT